MLPYWCYMYKLRKKEQQCAVLTNQLTTAYFDEYSEQRILKTAVWGLT